MNMNFIIIYSLKYRLSFNSFANENTNQEGSLMRRVMSGKCSTLITYDKGIELGNMRISPQVKNQQFLID